MIRTVQADARGSISRSVGSKQSDPFAIPVAVVASQLLEASPSNHEPGFGTDFLAACSGLKGLVEIRLGLEDS
jgi:hypothetical protein